MSSSKNDLPGDPGETSKRKAFKPLAQHLLAAGAKRTAEGLVINGKLLSSEKFVSAIKKKAEECAKRLKTDSVKTAVNQHLTPPHSSSPSPVDGERVSDQTSSRSELYDENSSLRPPESPDSQGGLESNEVQVNNNQETFEATVSEAAGDGAATTTQTNDEVTDTDKETETEAPSAGSSNEIGVVEEPGAQDVATDETCINADTECPTSTPQSEVDDEAPILHASERIEEQDKDTETELSLQNTLNQAESEDAVNDEPAVTSVESVETPATSTPAQQQGEKENELIAPPETSAGSEKDKQTVTDTQSPPDSCNQESIVEEPVLLCRQSAEPSTADISDQSTELRIVEQEEESVTAPADTNGRSEEANETETALPPSPTGALQSNEGGSESAPESRREEEATIESQTVQQTEREEEEEEDDEEVEEQTIFIRSDIFEPSTPHPTNSIADQIASFCDTLTEDECESTQTLSSGNTTAQPESSGNALENILTPGTSSVASSNPLLVQAILGNSSGGTLNAVSSAESATLPSVATAAPLQTAHQAPERLQISCSVSAAAAPAQQPAQDLQLSRPSQAVVVTTPANVVHAPLTLQALQTPLAPSPPVNASATADRTVQEACVSQNEISRDLDIAVLEVVNQMEKNLESIKQLVNSSSHLDASAKFKVLSAVKKNNFEVYESVDTLEAGLNLKYSCLRIRENKKRLREVEPNIEELAQYFEVLLEATTLSKRPQINQKMRGVLVVLITRMLRILGYFMCEKKTGEQSDRLFDNVNMLLMSKEDLIQKWQEGNIGYQTVSFWQCIRTSTRGPSYMQGALLDHSQLGPKKFMERVQKFKVSYERSVKADTVAPAASQQCAPANNTVARQFQQGTGQTCQQQPSQNQVSATGIQHQISTSPRQMVASQQLQSSPLGQPSRPVNQFQQQVTRAAYNPATSTAAALPGTVNQMGPPLAPGRPHLENYLAGKRQATVQPMVQNRMHPQVQQQHRLQMQQYQQQHQQQQQQQQQMGSHTYQSSNTQQQQHGPVIPGALAQNPRNNFFPPRHGLPQVQPMRISTPPSGNRPNCLGPMRQQYQLQGQQQVQPQSTYAGVSSQQRNVQLMNMRLPGTQGTTQQEAGLSEVERIVRETRNLLERSETQFTVQQQHQSRALVSATAARTCSQDYGDISILQDLPPLTQSQNLAADAQGRPIIQVHSEGRMILQMPYTAGSSNASSTTSNTSLSSAQNRSMPSLGRTSQSPSSLRELSNADLNSVLNSRPMQPTIPQDRAQFQMQQHSAHQNVNRRGNPSPIGGQSPGGGVVANAIHSVATTPSPTRLSNSPGYMISIPSPDHNSAQEQANSIYLPDANGNLMLAPAMPRQQPTSAAYANAVNQTGDGSGAFW